MMQMSKMVVGGMPLQNLIFTGLLALGVIFMIVATAIPSYTADTEHGKMSIGMFKYSVADQSQPISDYTCASVKTRLQGAGAMCILGIFVSIAAVATVALFTLGKEVPVINFKFTPLSAAMPSFVCAGFVTLAWILQANAYNTAFEGSEECRSAGALKDTPNMSLGGSFGFLVFLMIYYISIGVTFIVMNKGAAAQPDDKKYTDFNAAVA